MNNINQAKDCLTNAFNALQVYDNTYHKTDIHAAMLLAKAAVEVLQLEIKNREATK